MGPITPLEGSKEPRQRTIKWIDNDEEKTQGPMLVTSKSKDDLIVKERDGSIPEVETHKKEHSKKSAIKQFKLDINVLTGIQNFDKLSKDPLKLPQYAIDIQRASEGKFTQSQMQQSQQQSQQDSAAKGGNLFYKKENPDIQESELEEIS